MSSKNTPTGDASAVCLRGDLLLQPSLIEFERIPDLLILSAQSSSHRLRL